MTKKIMVTGSSGTIGTALCENLLSVGHEVVGIDYRPNIWSNEVSERTINLDLRDKQKVKTKMPSDIDLIIHLAANARVYNLVIDPGLATDNILSIVNTLEFARKNNIKNFIFSSSREVYGNSKNIIHTEDEASTENCESPYTASKISGEAMVHAYHQCYGIDYIIFRFSNVYGKYDNSDRLIPLFIKNTIKGLDLKVFGKEKLLDFTHIDDTVNGIVLGINKFKNAKGHFYNIAYGQGTSILEVAQQIKTLLRSNNKIIMEDNRTGEVVKYIADITKAKNKLGYVPRITINQGIKKAVDWYVNYYDESK